MFPIIDMHCDTTSVIMKPELTGSGEKKYLLKNDLHIDAERLKKGGYMCQCFAMFTAKPLIEKTGLTPMELLLFQNDVWDREIGACAEFLRPALTGSGIEKNFKEGFVSAIKTVEEGLVYMGAPENLKLMYDKGVRMSTLTWDYENELAYPNITMWETVDGAVHSCLDEGLPAWGDKNVKRLWFVPDKERGLKERGREFVKLMEELGMVIDTSHLNDAGIDEILRLVRPETPVIASHSNARAVTDHARNLTDDFLRRIADHGGVCGMNFASEFLHGRGDDFTKISDITAHIKYIRKVAGVDVIGMGSDHDGIGSTLETGGCQGMQLIADALLKEGFSEDEVEKIMYKNVLRVFKQVLG